MRKLLKKFFIPHEVNNFHPHSTRHGSMLAYALIFILLNYFVFPVLGISNNKAFASNIQAEELVKLANRDRSKQSLPPLNFNTRLSAAALAKGNDMIAKGYWAHFGPSGESPWQFIMQSGYDYSFAGENLAKDFNSSDAVHTAWMNSKSHKENIMNANFREVGIAIVSGIFQGKESIIVVQMFGTTVHNSNLANNSQRPQILSPKNGEIFSTPNIPIQGYDPSDSTLLIFSNGEVIGELTKEAAFTSRVDLNNSNNLIYLENSKSTPSEAVNIIVDTTPPDLGKIVLNVSKKGDKFNVVIATQEDLSSIEYKSQNGNKKFNKRVNTFSETFKSSEIKDQIITIILKDTVGNTTEHDINLVKELENKNKTKIIGATTSTSSPTNPLTSGLTWLSDLNVPQKINLLIVLMIMSFIIIDFTVLMKKRKHREHSSTHSMNLAVLFIVLTGVIVR